MTLEELPQNVRKNIEIWLEGSFDNETKNSIKELVKSSPQRAIDAFYQTLSFGTGGLRALMGVGTNRINLYTISFAAQAVASCVKKHSSQVRKSVAITFDSRLGSQEFAEAAAEVFRNNGIDVFIGKRPLPTPFLSFCIRRLQANAGVMITASHNPPEYNGFKVYWKEGGQVLPPHSDEILQEFSLIHSPKDLKQVEEKGSITYLSTELEEEYIEYCCQLSPDKKLCTDKGSLLNIVYTNLHGTGIAVIPRLFSRMGFTNFSLVELQKELDGHFPTVSKPNPEEINALELGIEQLIKEKGDLLLATDPDSDRVSCVIRKPEGSVTMLTGNQIAALLLEYILHKYWEEGQKKHLVAIKSLVTTELFRAICNRYAVECIDVPTGFKYIAQQIEKLQQDPLRKTFIFAAEESYGYLSGTQVRDKDACLASQLIAECALSAKLEGKTLLDYLDDLYLRYGFFFETQRSLNYEETLQGKEQLAKTLEKVSSPSMVQQLFPHALSFTNYQETTLHNFSSNEKVSLQVPATDMYKISFTGLDLLIRPSGTEPKIKFYFNFLKQPFENREKQVALCENYADKLIASL